MYYLGTLKMQERPKGGVLEFPELLRRARSRDFARELIVARRSLCRSIKQRSNCLRSNDDDL
jgi:hypothetical protein